MESAQRNARGVDTARYAALKALWSTRTGRISEEMRAAIGNRAVRDLIRNDADFAREIIRRFQANEPGSEQLLLNAHIALILSLVRKYGRASPADYEDWVSTGRLALLEGAARFDLTRTENDPLAYLYTYIKGYLIREIANTGSCVRIPAHNFKAVKPPAAPSLYRLTKAHVWFFTEAPENVDWDVEERFEDSLTDSKPLAEELLSDEELADKQPLLAAYLIGKLTPRFERVIVDRYYKDMTLAAIGTKDCLTRERVRQIEAEAFISLRQKAASLGAPIDDHDDYQAWVCGAIAKLRKRLDDEEVCQTTRMPLVYERDAQAFCASLTAHSDVHGQLRLVTQTDIPPSELLWTLRAVTGIKMKRDKFLFRRGGPVYRVALACQVCGKGFGFETNVQVREPPVEPPPPLEPFAPFLRAEDIARRLGIPERTVAKKLKKARVKVRALYKDGSLRRPLWHESQVPEIKWTLAV